MSSADSTSASAGGSVSSGFMGYSTMTVFLVVLLLIVVAMLGYRSWQKSKNINGADEADIVADSGEPETGQS
jgi:hypothetical protein